MPVKRRIAKTRTGWNDSHRFALVHADYFEVFADESDERAGWEAMRHELLTEWIAKKPGSRPAAWWKYDAPGERQFHGTEVKWTFGPGTPESERLPIERAPRGYYGVRVPARESEARFLERHGLLTDDELQHLERMEN